MEPAGGGEGAKSDDVEGTMGEDETKLRENEGKHSMDQGSDCESESVQSQRSSSSSIPKVAIPDDDLVVQIFARLDGSSYRQARSKDAKSINENFLLPPHFPWHSRTRLSQKMMKTMPRDIDDLPVISHCEDELHAPFGDFQGPFGFGRYENGHARGNYSNALLKPGSAAAAARRSDDPGVLELNVQIPLQTSIDTINSKEPGDSIPAEKWETKQVEDPNRIDLPFHWSKRRSFQWFDHRIDHSARTRQESHVLNESEFELQKVTESKTRARSQLALAVSSIRKWKISLKVGGVSSRATLMPAEERFSGETLFLSSGVINKDCGQGPKKSRKVIRPMLRLASLPQSIQYGQTVSMEKASEMDKKGFAFSLGSYDCRYTDALLNPKRDSFNRSKRIEVGRTRLLWSNLIECGNRVTFNSLITGRRMQDSNLRRPTLVKVSIRLNGRLLMEKAVENVPTAITSNVRKRKHSTRQAENEPPASKLRIQCPESRTDEEIDAALHNHSTLVESNQRLIPQRGGNGAVVYLEKGSKLPLKSDLNRTALILNILKSNQKKSAPKKPKRSPPAKVNVTAGGIQFLKRFTPPRFACVPLEDGLLRTVCLNAGNMPSTSVHQVLREISKQECGRRCSVCWSNEGSGKEGVQECSSCGLLAHANCCLGKGEFSTVSNNPNAETKVEIEHWKCTVCCNFADQPRRKRQMPSRFVDDDMYELSNQTGDNGTANGNANVPSPRCSLCPHRGGAMSPLDSGDWAHEVCRIWSGIDLSGGSRTKDCPVLFRQFPSGLPLSNVCALCGTGGLEGNKSMQFNAGLTRCAARGCYVTFHPMCALLARLASKVGLVEKGDKGTSVRTRKKSRHTGQMMEDKNSYGNENFAADKKLCEEYTLQLMQLRRREPAGTTDGKEEDETDIIPVAFCGIHNPQREGVFFGCLPCGVAA